MLLLGAMIGMTAAALTYATESFAEKKLEEHILEKKMSKSSETNDFDDADIVCEETTDEETAPVTVDNNACYCAQCGYKLDQKMSFCPGCGLPINPPTIPDEDDTICEECEAEEVETPDTFRHGVTVKFRDHDLARTADGINQIKDCTYKFIGYNPENPLTCFITRGSKQRRFEVLVASLEIVE